MTDPIKIIKKYISPDSKAFQILVAHSTSVKDLALKIADHNPHFTIDRELLIQAAMLHDIGMIKTNAPDLSCFGEHPYICHGYIGSEILEKEGLHNVTLFCERHTGTGISKEEILRNNLPIPSRDMIPVSIEEKILCYADKFFSKSGRNLTRPKKLKTIHKNIVKYGEDKLKQFDGFIEMFGIYYVYG